VIAEILLTFSVGAVALLLVLGGIRKVVQPSDLALTLSFLGVRAHPTQASRLFGFVEVMAGMAFAAAPWALGPQAAVMALYLCFAGAAVLALYRGASIPCNCGTLGSSARRLGWPHVLQAAPVVVLLVVLRMAEPVSVATGSVSAAVILSAINLLLARELVLRRRELRRQRRALLEVNAAIAAVQRPTKVASA
jgi:hypothetical protein